MAGGAPRAREDRPPPRGAAAGGAPPARVRTALDLGTRLLDAGRDLVEKVPLPRTDDIELRLHKAQRRLDRLRRLSEIYGPYVELDCVFDDRATRELLAQLHPDDRERFSFDVDAIDWAEYLQEIHLPALRRFAVPRAPGPQRTRAPPRPRLAEGRPALAVFDVEGVVLDTTVAHF